MESTPQTVLLIGGTSETAVIADGLARLGWRVWVSTATDVPLDTGASPSVRRICGRKTAAEFAALIRVEKIAHIVVAAHPYAVEVRREIVAAARMLVVPVVGYNRPVDTTGGAGVDVVRVASHEEAARLAAADGRPVLLTTGARHLLPYATRLNAAAIPFWARVLPHSEVHVACAAAGLRPDQIITGRGPFSAEQNETLLRHLGAGVLVTKDSGKAGGMSAKWEAARRCGCRVIVVARPLSDVALRTFDSLEALWAYFQWGRPSTDLSTSAAGHGGNLRALAAAAGCRPEQMMDFSANINPLGPVDALRAVVAQSLEQVTHYPDPESTALVRAVHDVFGWPVRHIVPAHGASELLYALCRAMKRPRAVIPVPSYSDYARAARMADMEIVPVPLREEDDFNIAWESLGARLRPGDMVLLGQPNNPTGVLLPYRQLKECIREYPDCLFVVDESFIEFVHGYVSIADDLPPNAVMIRSMTKMYAIPGLRLGYAITPDVASAARLRTQLIPWSVNCVAAAVGAASLADRDYAARTQAFTSAARAELVQGLRCISGIRVWEGCANFVLVKWPGAESDARAWHRQLLAHGVAVRLCDNFVGLDARYVRLAVRPPREQERLLGLLGALAK